MPKRKRERMDRVLPVRFPDDLAERAEAHAEREGVPLSWVIRHATERYLRHQELAEEGRTRAERVVEAYQNDLETSLRNVGAMNVIGRDR